MKSLITTTILLMFTISTQVVAQHTPIFPKGEKAPNVHHTGDVWLYHLSNADSTFNYNIAVATFSAGAKLDWHFHPAGQQLLIIQGTGYYQERGKPLQVVNKGDKIKCLPNVEHWHAATPVDGVTYLAITGNKKTKWLEPISNEMYKSLKEN